MKNIFQTKRSVWLVLFITVCIIAGFEGSAESISKVIQLKSSGGQLEKILVAKNSEVQLNNGSGTTFHNFMVIQLSTGKRMVSIEDIKPSSSFNLAFDREETYIPGYSEDGSKVLNTSTCLQIDVVGLRSI